MKKQQLLFLHIFYWSIYFLGTFVFPYVMFGSETDYFKITFTITSFICFYINYFFVIPKFFHIQNLYKTLFAFLLSVFCFVLIRYFVEEIFSPYFFGLRNYSETTSLSFYFYDNIYYSSTTIFVSTVFCLFKLISETEIEKRQLIEQKKNSELQALKTQINPHFIFNTLNNIYSLVYQNSDKALPAIEELSQLLRYSTKDLQKDYIPLNKEIGYLDSLIELEKLRIKNPELLIIEKKINFPNLNISPMLLVPFVENAFKHGDFAGKGFTLIISDEHQKLHFQLYNFKKQKSKDSVSGIGIGNVNKRLEILYPKRYKLDINETATDFSVDLTIDLRDE